VYLSCAQGGPCLNNDPALHLGFDKNGVYFEPQRIPPRIRAAWSESMRPRDRFDFRDFINSIDEMNLRYDDPTPEQREQNQADDTETFARLHRKHSWFLGCGFTRVRPDGEFDERGRWVLEVLVKKGMLDQAKRDVPRIVSFDHPTVHTFRGFPIKFVESGPIVAQMQRDEFGRVSVKPSGMGAILLCDEIKGLSREDLDKISAGSSITASQLSPEDASTTRQQLVEIAREAQAREARNAKISAAVAAGSVLVAAIGLYVNYRRTHSAVV